ncbi:MAG TPA: ABC transporter permease subunit [Gemmatimonadaceae bacterium]|jgi:ABC-2 type transport system permease protein|nr:ABC transporter permease subunit [Gemmatimonadaceae bacterium]
MSGPLDRTVMWLTWRQLFARRRLWTAIAFSLAPFVLALVFMVVADDGDEARISFYVNMGREIVLGTLVPVAAMIFATTAFGGEIDDGTLIYLLVKPIARWRVALSKYVVAVLSTAAVGAVAVVLPWLVLRGAQLPARTVGALLAAVSLASVAYCAIFLAAGLYTRRALVASLLYIVLVEEVGSRSLAGLQRISVRALATALAQSISHGTLPSLPNMLPMSTVAAAATIIVVVALASTLWKIAHYELAERL